MAYKRTFTKAQKKAYAIKIDNLYRFCDNHNIDILDNGNTFIFTYQGKKYVISNCIGDSKKQKGLIYIRAGKLRVPDIWTLINSGFELNGLGRIKG